MPADDLTDVDLVPGQVADPEAPVPRTLGVRIYEIAVTLPIVAYIVWSFIQNPDILQHTGVPPWQIIIWIVAIAGVDLMPVPTTMSSVNFSLSFPIELSVAMLFPVPVAALIALLGTSDKREFRGELPLFKGLFIRAQIAGAAICESLVFKHMYPEWRRLGEGGYHALVWKVGIAVVCASIVGYLINLLFVAVYNYFALGESPLGFIREVHAGVFGEDGKTLRTRAGVTVKLVDLLQEAIERAAVVVAERTDLDDEERARIARTVGIGAVKYADLCNDREKDYSFDWDRMLALEGNTSVYLQYANARVLSVIARAGGGVGADTPLRLDAPAEKALALKLLQFPVALAAATTEFAPHKLCTYLYETAATFSTFYENCPILKASDDESRRSRLAL